MGWSSGSLSWEISDKAPVSWRGISVPGSISIVYIVRSLEKLEKHALLSAKGDGKNNRGRWGGTLESGGS